MPPMAAAIDKLQMLRTGQAEWPRFFVLLMCEEYLFYFFFPFSSPHQQKKNFPSSSSRISLSFSSQLHQLTSFVLSASIDSLRPVRIRRKSLISSHLISLHSTPPIAIMEYQGGGRGCFNCKFFVRSSPPAARVSGTHDPFSLLKWPSLDGYPKFLRLLFLAIHE